MTDRQPAWANNLEILRRLGLDVICPPATEIVITLRVNEQPKIQITTNAIGKEPATPTHQQRIARLTYIDKEGNTP